MASPRDPGQFSVFATCPVVISVHIQTIANQGKKRPGTRVSFVAEDVFHGFIAVAL